MGVTSPRTGECAPAYDDGPRVTGGRNMNL
jgi:hypothetical protein